MRGTERGRVRHGRVGGHLGCETRRTTTVRSSLAGHPVTPKTPDKTGLTGRRGRESTRGSEVERRPKQRKVRHWWTSVEHTITGNNHWLGNSRLWKGKTSDLIGVRPATPQTPESLTPRGPDVSVSVKEGPSGEKSCRGVTPQAGDPFGPRLTHPVGSPTRSLG